MTESASELTIEELDELQRLEDADCLDLVAHSSRHPYALDKLLIKLIAAARLGVSVGELRRALKPFADKADQVTFESWRTSYGDVWPVHVKYLKAARDAYYAETKPDAAYGQDPIPDRDCLRCDCQPLVWNPNCPRHGVDDAPLQQQGREG